MVLSRIFRQVNPRKFDYQPRYFDKEKAEIEERFKMVHTRSQDTTPMTKERLAKLSKEFEAIRQESYIYRRKQASQSRFRFVIILFLLAYLCYWILTRF